MVAASCTLILPQKLSKCKLCSCLQRHWEYHAIRQEKPRLRDKVRVGCWATTFLNQVQNNLTLPPRLVLRSSVIKCLQSQTTNELQCPHYQLQDAEYYCDNKTDKLLHSSLSWSPQNDNIKAEHRENCSGYFSVVILPKECHELQSLAGRYLPNIFINIQYALEKGFYNFPKLEVTASDSVWRKIFWCSTFVIPCLTGRVGGTSQVVKWNHQQLGKWTETQLFVQLPTIFPSFFIVRMLTDFLLNLATLKLRADFPPVNKLTSVIRPSVTAG